MGKAVNNQNANEARTYEYALGDELRGERATLGKSLLDVQRDLRIRAAYIAAIEDAQADVFPNPAFVPGYIRSYARYLGLDADEIYARFCRESGFAATAPASAPRGGARSAQPLPPRGTGSFRPNFPMAEVRRSRLPSVPVSALGSLLVLCGLMAGLGYGGWTVLQNIQRVQFAPVEEMPLAVAEMQPLEAPEALVLAEPGLSELAKPVAAAALADLYRQQELEVPILVPRDGPIAGIDPERIGLLAGYGSVQEATILAAGRNVLQPVAVATTEPDAAFPDPQVVAVAERPEITVLAERAAWMRVYLENGTVIFERILEKGEGYSPPDDVDAPLIWAGNSGSVYVRVGDTLRGPLGPGTRAVRDILLEPQSLTEQFPLVETVPEGLTESEATVVQRAEASLVVP